MDINRTLNISWYRDLKPGTFFVARYQKTFQSGICCSVTRVDDGAMTRPGALIRREAGKDRVATTMAPEGSLSKTHVVCLPAHFAVSPIPDVIAGGVDNFEDSDLVRAVDGPVCLVAIDDGHVVLINIANGNIESSDRTAPYLIFSRWRIRVRGEADNDVVDVVSHGLPASGDKI